MRKLAFFNHTLCYRGTTKAIFNYMLALPKAFENISLHYIFIKDDPGNRFGFARHLLDNGIEICGVSTYSELSEMSNSFDFLYHVTSADSQGLDWFKQIKSRSTLIHQVGYQPPEYNLSNHFAYTSYWQSYNFTNGSASVLPYIIPPPMGSLDALHDLRSTLGIPKNDLVLGRHGGGDTWNLRFASSAVDRSVRSRSDLWFVFVGTPRFCNHERVIFLDSITSLQELERFFTACDAMIHARWEGETFGMACAEFLSRKKPIITWSESREQNHIFLSGRSAITFNSESDLLHVLLSLNKDYLHHKASLINLQLLDMYRPEVIVEQFRKYI